MPRFFVLLIALVLAGGLGFFWAATKTDQKVKREPLQKAGMPLKAPAAYEKRERVEAGKSETYDPKPRVRVVDEKAGKYEFRWIGYDGKEKVIAYQHPDSIDVVVSGSVEKSSDGNYVYSYSVDILPSSATYLYSFGLQNFAQDTQPIEINDRPTTLADLRILKNFTHLPDDGKPKNFENTILIGEMSNAIRRFKDGNWIAFGILPDFENQVVPGGRLRIKLVSKAAPGLVGCSAVAGPRTMKGVGEHMPSELEEIMPGYEAWPSGSTVGPVAFLDSLSQSQRVNYLLDNMLQFEKLGWITPSARTWYEKNMRNDIEAALNRTQKDLDSDQISSEVFAMIQAIK
ncbi:MAG TPA: hypothetical protein VGQ41_20530 [Pyrinomonadaceae bacterium]|nr:hypothetical protein [Pyrinomonadaceae bacterium]